ncbi:MAG: TFIIB-type zinc ribbon-containing protein [Thermoprotei archaeon]
MHEKCPLCGNSLIWDYVSGLIICSSCGYVVDRIYDYGPIYEDEETIIWREIKTRSNPRRNPLIGRVRRHNKLYRLASSYIRNKPWLEIDYDKLFEKGKLVNTIKSRASIEAEKNISEMGLWDIVNEGLKIIEERNPAALARSSRGKYALAYIVAVYTKKHKFPSLEEVMKTFNISETSYRRLLKIAREIVSVSKPILLS